MYSTKKQRRKIGICPNCTEILSAEANYCPTCGQENHDLKVPIGHLIYEFVESIFHFDIKVWETLKTVLYKPGKISSDFVDGKRARYVPPARLYVFVSFVFFILVNSATSDSINTNLLLNNNTPIIDFDNIQIEEAEDFKFFVSKLAINGFKTDSLWEDKDTQLFLLVQRAAKDSLKLLVDQKQIPKEELSLSESYLERAFFDELLQKGEVVYENSILMLKTDFFVKFDGEQTELSASIFRDALKNPEKMDSLVTSSQTPLFSRNMQKNFIYFIGTLQFGTGVEKRLMLEKISQKAIKYLSFSLFFFMPLVAFILWLLFRRNRPMYYEHAIFSIHQHTVIISLLIFGFVLDNWLNPSVVWQVIFAICFFYLLFSIKNFYEQKWGKSILKYLVLIVIYSVLTVFIFASVSILSFV